MRLRGSARQCSVVTNIVRMYPILCKLKKMNEGLLGKAARVADTAVKVHGIIKAASAATPYVAAGLRFAGSLL